VARVPLGRGLIKVSKIKIKIKIKIKNGKLKIIKGIKE
jgi:hypothetical protein